MASCTASCCVAGGRFNGQPPSDKENAMNTGAGQRPSSQFVEITGPECEDLLAANRFGRVAWNAPDGPQVLPVTYQIYNSEVVFRTSPFGALSQLTHRHPVAFEIDAIDSEAERGWSVVVRGMSHGVVQGYDLVKLWTMDGIVPWASGTRNAFIAITPRSISGRRVRAPFAD
jgi:nitroimidazol reductase NimA-like FMN-containing flavoprotein (pyridoxamine 5'-phosphate oxidase superfamily)